MWTKLSKYIGISFFEMFYNWWRFKDMTIALLSFALKRKVTQTVAKQEKTLQRLRTAQKIKVVFFLQTPSVWKYDRLYKMMEHSDKFDPTVVVSPYNVHLAYDKNECLRVMKATEGFARQKGYRYISTYDGTQWLDVKKTLQPDIVFFSKPYKDTLPQYHIYNFSEQLTLYVPYGINCMNLFRNNYQLPFHNLLWKLLVETEYQKQYAIEYEQIKGRNAVVVGALAMEDIMRNDYSPQDVWKPQNKPKKRIIWAPHHTVDYLFNFSNFLVYADNMLRLAEKYKDTVQWAFKPHPVLKFKLINIWGAKRTEEYYKKWQDLENGQLEQGDYTDLFLTSDAMIHDSGSFTVEYLYTRKPVLFQVRNEEVKKQWNSFGQDCFGLHYKAYDIEQTEQFIQNVVLGGNDRMKQDRELFYQSVLCPKDGKMPSENIYNLLINALQQSF